MDDLRDCIDKLLAENALNDKIIDTRNKSIDDIVRIINAQENNCTELEVENEDLYLKYDEAEKEIARLKYIITNMVLDRHGPPPAYE